MRSRFAIRELAVQDPELYSGLERVCRSCQQMKLGFDEKGRLVTLNADSVLAPSGPATQTIFIYSGDSLFLSVTRIEKTISAADSILEFSLYELRGSEFWRKTYTPDADLNIYLSRLFPDFTGDNWELYLREMKWRKEATSMHFLSGEMASKLLQEIFISYRYTGEYELIENEETGEVMEVSQPEHYQFTEDQFTSEEELSGLESIFSIRREQVNFVPADKTLKKIWRSAQLFNLTLTKGWEWHFQVSDN